MYRLGTFVLATVYSWSYGSVAASLCRLSDVSGIKSNNRHRTFKSERERDEQTQNQIDNTNNNVGEVSKDVDDLKSSDEDTQQLMDELKKNVSDTRDNMLGYINCSGRDVIRFLPNRENPTDIVASENGGNYGMRWNSKGIYYDGKGTVAIDNRGNVYADNFVGQYITGVHIRGGEISGVTISGDTDISLGSGSTRTSITRYGISTPNMTVNQIDGVRAMNIESGYLMIN